MSKHIHQISRVRYLNLAPDLRSPDLTPPDQFLLLVNSAFWASRNNLVLVHCHVNMMSAKFSDFFTPSPLRNRLFQQENPLVLINLGSNFDKNFCWKLTWHLSAKTAHSAKMPKLRILFLARVGSNQCRAAGVIKKLTSNLKSLYSLSHYGVCWVRTHAWSVINKWTVVFTHYHL